MKVWLDDMRKEPVGYILAKTVEEAKNLLLNNEVTEMSLDHDLGACTTCLNGQTIDEWLVNSNFQSMPNCTHMGTGYDLVCWMEENNIWPKYKPKVHSANPVGRLRMQQVIDKKYD